MKQEIYRSFEGKLNVENRTGHIIYETKDFYEIEFLNIESEKKGKLRIRKEILDKKDFNNTEKLAEIGIDIENGCANYGQCWYNKKWYGYKEICRIQKKYQDNNWKRHAI